MSMCVHSFIVVALETRATKTGRTTRTSTVRLITRVWRGAACHTRAASLPTTSRSHCSFQHTLHGTPRQTKLSELKNLHICEVCADVKDY